MEQRAQHPAPHGQAIVLADISQPAQDRDRRVELTLCRSAQAHLAPALRGALARQGALALELTEARRHGRPQAPLIAVVPEIQHRVVAKGERADDRLKGSGE